jgi:ketosteroid isomerase-like protein
VSDEDFEVIKRAWSAFGRQDEEALLRELDPDVKAVPFGAAMEGKSYSGHDGVMTWWRDEILASWEYFEVIPEHFRRVDDAILVTGRWHVRGKGSGVELDITATWRIKVRDGKIVFWQTYTDRDEALRDAGVDD